MDPLEGTNLCATGQPNAIATIAVADQGCFLHAPDMYMDKIAVGPRAKGAIDLRKSAAENVLDVGRRPGALPRRHDRGDPRPATATRR